MIDESFSTAGDNKIPWLYRYQSANLSHLAEMLSEHRLHVVNPRLFNDPWDAQPFLYIPTNDEPEKELVVNFMADGAKPPLTESEKEDLKKSFLLHEPNFEKFILEMTRGVREHAFNTFRLYCLTQKSNCELMWAHYSNKHTGIRLQFSTQYPLFKTAYKIEYAHEYPKILPIKEMVNTRATMLVKSQSWSYEEEYRIVTFDSNSNAALAGKVPTHILSTQDKLPFDISALESITFGCRFPENEIQTYKKVINSLAPNVRLLRARKIENHYDLRIDPI